MTDPFDQEKELTDEWPVEDVGKMVKAAELRYMLFNPHIDQSWKDQPSSKHLETIRHKIDILEDEVKCHNSNPYTMMEVCADIINYMAFIYDSEIDSNIELDKERFNG